MKVKKDPFILLKGLVVNPPILIKVSAKDDEIFQINIIYREKTC